MYFYPPVLYICPVTKTKMRTKNLKKITLEDLEFCDGVYNVGKLVDVDGSPWVSKEMAEEILEMANSHTDWVLDEVLERKDSKLKEI